MAKKKRKAARGRKKSNILPLAAIGVGILLFWESRKRTPTIDTNLPTLPTSNNSGASIGIRPDRSRYITSIL